jgi:hypothetical protein
MKGGEARFLPNSIKPYWEQSLSFFLTKRVRKRLFSGNSGSSAKKKNEKLLSSNKLSVS